MPKKDDPMPTSTNPVKRDPIEKVLAEFDAKREILDEFCARTEGLIEDLLVDAQLRFQSIQARVKKKNKLKDKYLSPKKEYAKLDDITDQAALRVIVYYEDEIDRVAELIKKEFNLLPEFCVDRRKIDPDRFGYDALNIVCTHANKRTVDVPFKKYANLKFEIQVTTVLSHAWSEIEHEWYDLQDAYPNPIKRRFSRLAALLELAESEFLTLRDKKANYKQSVGIRVETDVPNIAIDSVSLATFVALEPVVKDLDNMIAGIVKANLVPAEPKSIEMQSQMTKLVGLANLEELRRSLNDYYGPLVEYIQLVQPLWSTKPDLVVNSGVCVYQLGLMLLGAQGQDKLIKAMKTLGMVNIQDWVAPQAAIAADVLSKHKK